MVDGILASIYSRMKVRMTRNVLVEIEKSKLGEVWDKHLSRWDELNVEKMDVQKNLANLLTVDGDIYLDVPVDAFTVIS